MVAIYYINLNHFVEKQMEEEMKNNAITVSCFLNASYSGGYSFENGRLKKGDSYIDETQIFEELKKYTGLDYSLSYEDKRIVCTIKNEEEGIQGTYLSNSIYKDVIANNEPQFCPNVSIGNEKYYAYYFPLYNDGTSVVILGLAKYSDVIHHDVKNMFLPLILTTLAIAIVIMSVSFFISKDISDSIMDICSFVENIKDSNFHKKMPEKLLNRDDELGAISNEVLEMRNSLQSLIEIDPLTQIYNRRTGYKILEKIKEKAKKKSTPYSVAIGDIDFFKKVNDTYGHDAGDAVLKSIASLIKKNIKKYGYVARWGGEEFMLIFDGHTVDESVIILENILAKIRLMEVKYPPNTIKVTMTFGVTTGNWQKTDEEIFNMADKKLYIGKERGRNQIVSKVRKIQKTIE